MRIISEKIRNCHFLQWLLVSRVLVSPFHCCLSGLCCWFFDHVYRYTVVLHGTYCLLFCRLTPMLVFTLLFYMALFPYVGDGPMYSTMSIQPENCRSSWWTNILYLQNIIGMELDKQVCGCRFVFTPVLLLEVQVIYG